VVTILFFLKFVFSYIASHLINLLLYIPYSNMVSTWIYI
jgi:hypothetical protein